MLPRFMPACARAVSATCPPFLWAKDSCCFCIEFPFIAPSFFCTLLLSSRSRRCFIVSDLVLSLPSAPFFACTGPCCLLVCSAAASSREKAEMTLAFGSEECTMLTVCFHRFPPLLVVSSSSCFFMACSVRQMALPGFGGPWYTPLLSAFALTSAASFLAVAACALLGRGAFAGDVACGDAVVCRSPGPCTSTFLPSGCPLPVPCSTTGPGSPPVGTPPGNSP
mmetsp:Transcript_51976/g.129394  ORF Transcript_51976/g.129394 Transcript_51976/m.129394 type:complete len:223 (-) Transcript_51976:146-814(-)